ncbi:MAG: type I-D CRISPR-associated protein Cas5/Csc1 [Abditibacteriales bacterium]|nr:type I-D CRISPR-associated protein Cas5/Csc1 [Abditibacteriales bacterium]
MRVYRCDLTLHDYLFFATTERGRVAETGQFLHNYALTYAVGWARSPYRNEIQQPHYAQELSEVTDRYLTPARLLNGSYALVQYNTLPETFWLMREQSVGYPNWGFIKMLKPFSRFRFYALAQREVTFPRFIRLGKFMAKAEIQVAPATVVRRRTDACQVEPLLNWEDLAVKPVPYEVITSALPTRLVGHSRFEQVEHVIARFADDSEVVLPLPMGYPGGQLCSLW